MTMAGIRQWHTTIGMLIAPSVMFFALTGLLQIFHLHEPHGGYKPFAIVEKLGEVHKDQAFRLGHHRPPQAVDAVAVSPPRPVQASPDSDDDANLRTYALKWCFALVALGLASSTILGIWVGLTHVRRWRLNVSLLAIGVALPVIIIIA